MTEPSTWALPAPALKALDNRLAVLKPRLAVESGSGESTLVLARHSEKVVSLEHDRRWAAHVRARFLTEAQPMDHVRIINAKLGHVMTPKGRFPWYRARLPDGIDFALIDGPPCRIGRGGAGWQILPKMSPDGEVWVDDYQHMESHPCHKNRQWVEDWCEAFGWKVAEAQTFDMISLGAKGKPYKDHDRIAVLKKA